MLKRRSADRDGFRKCQKHMWTQMHPGFWADQRLPNHGRQMDGTFPWPKNKNGTSSAMWSGPDSQTIWILFVLFITRRGLGWGAWASLICMGNPGPDTVPPACTRWISRCRGGLPWNREEGLSQHPLHRLTASVSRTAQDSVQLALPCIFDKFNTLTIELGHSWPPKN